jgi:peroxiredoxin
MLNDAITVKIDDISITDVTSHGTTISWKTDKAVPSWLEITPQNDRLGFCVGKTEKGTNHKWILDNCLPNTTYTFKVAADGLDYPEKFKNTSFTEISTRSNECSFTTLRASSPPLISDLRVSNLACSTTGCSVEVTWKTDVPATSQVIYGASTNYGTSQPPQEDTTLTVFHDVILYSISPQTTFHYKVISTDSSGNETSSPDATFVTSIGCPRLGDRAPDLVLKDIEGNDVRLSDFRGHTVLIYTWFISCPLCIKDLDFIQKSRTSSQAESPIILAINISDSIPSVKDFIQGKKYEFIFLSDWQLTTHNSFCIPRPNSVPNAFLISPDGIFKHVKIGCFNDVDEVIKFIGYEQ